MSEFDSDINTWQERETGIAGEVFSKVEDAFQERELIKHAAEDDADSKIVDLVTERNDPAILFAYKLLPQISKRMEARAEGDQSRIDKPIQAVTIEHLDKARGNIRAVLGAANYHYRPFTLQFGSMHPIIIRPGDNEARLLDIYEALQKSPGKKWKRGGF